MVPKTELVVGGGMRLEGLIPVEILDEASLTDTGPPKREPCLCG